MKHMSVLLVALAASFASLTGAKDARADEPDPTLRYSDKRQPPSGANMNLFLSGALVTGVFYAPAFASSYLWDESRGASDLRIPVAGPWMKIGQTKLCKADPSAVGCNDFMRVLGAILLVVDGIGQAGGVGLMLEALFMRTEPSGTETARHSPRYIHSQGASRKRTRLSFESGSVKWSATPLVGSSDELGLSLVGSF